MKPRVIRVYGDKRYQIQMLACYSKMYTVLWHSALYKNEQIVGISIYIKGS